MQIAVKFAVNMAVRGKILVASSAKIGIDTRAAFDKIANLESDLGFCRLSLD
jgi:hypothetical protein